MNEIKLENGVYTMKLGDYLPEIARKLYPSCWYSMLPEIYELNNLHPCTFIYAGMKIKMPHYW